MKELLKRIVPFLRPRPPLRQEDIKHILIVGSASLHTIRRALETMRTHYPTARLSLVLPYTQETSRQWAGVDVIPYKGVLSWGALQQRVTEMQCDLKLVLFTGEGHLLLKLLSFYLPARCMKVFTEGGGMFTWSFDDRLAIWNHFRWRWGSGGLLLAVIKGVGRYCIRLVLSFTALVLLLLWHAVAYVRRKVHQ